MKTFTVTGLENIEKTYDPAKRLDIFTFNGPESMQVSDGFHTMDEVYDHRITLFIALCKLEATFNELAAAQRIERARKIWRSKYHHPEDKEMYEGYFVMGIDTEPGRQISYHFPIVLWDECDFALQFVHAPKWDGHTPGDVLERLKKL